MGLETSNLPAIAGLFTDTDLFNISRDVGGGTFSSFKGDYSKLKTSLQNDLNLPNFYTANGNITGNRIVTMSGFNLSFLGGVTNFEDTATSGLSTSGIGVFGGTILENPSNTKLQCDGVTHLRSVVRIGPDTTNIASIIDGRLQVRTGAANTSPIYALGRETVASFGERVLVTPRNGVTNSVWGSGIKWRGGNFEFLTNTSSTNKGLTVILSGSPSSSAFPVAERTGALNIMGGVINQKTTTINWVGGSNQNQAFIHRVNGIDYKLRLRTI